MVDSLDRIRNLLQLLSLFVRRKVHVSLVFSASRQASLLGGELGPGHHLNDSCHEISGK